MEINNDQNLHKQFYFKTKGEGFKCKFLHSEFNKFLTSDCEGYLYFFDVYLDSLIDQNKPKFIKPYLKVNLEPNTIIYDFDITYNNSKIISGTSEQNSYLFDVNKLKTIQIFEGHQDSIKCVKFFKDNPNFLISGGKDGKLIYYDIRQNPLKFTILKNLKNERITGCDFFQDEKMILFSQTGTFNCSVLDLRKLYSFDSKKKKFQKIPEKCQLLIFDSLTHIKNQLKYLDNQMYNIDYIHSPFSTNILKNFDFIKQNYNLDNLFNKNESQFKAITNINLNHKHNILYTKDNFGKIFQYNLNSLGFSQPKYIGQIRQARLNSKISVDLNLQKIVVGVETSIYNWKLQKDNYISYKHIHCHNEFINFVDISEYDNNIILSVGDDKYGCLWIEETKKQNIKNIQFKIQLNTQCQFQI